MTKKLEEQPLITTPMNVILDAKYGRPKGAKVKSNSLDCEYEVDYEKGVNKNKTIWDRSSERANIAQ